MPDPSFTDLITAVFQFSTAVTVVVAARTLHKIRQELFYEIREAKEIIRDTKDMRNVE